MAALSKGIELPHLGTPQKAPVRVGGSFTIYQGSLLFALAAGGVTNVPAASLPFVGIATRDYGACVSGDIIEAWVAGVFQWPYIASITGADEGDALISDVSGTLSDNPADCVSAVDATVAVTDLLIGQILCVPSTGAGAWIQLKTGTGVYNANGWGG